MTTFIQIKAIQTSLKILKRHFDNPETNVPSFLHQKQEKTKKQKQKPPPITSKTEQFKIPQKLMLNRI